MKTSLKNKLAAIALAGSLGNSGCYAYSHYTTTPYTTTPLSFIPVLTVPQEAPFPEQEGKDSLDCRKVDCSKLTWQEAIKQIKTPEQAQNYLDEYFNFDHDEVRGFGINFLFFIYHNTNGKGESFKYNHSKAKGVCLDYATAAAALLSDDGFAPLLLVLQANDGESRHAVYLYKTKEGYGALGNSPISPGDSSVEKLVSYFNRSYGTRYDKYGIVNLDDHFTREEWVSGDVDLQIPLLDKWIKLKGEYR